MLLKPAQFKCFEEEQLFSRTKLNVVNGAFPLSMPQSSTFDLKQYLATPIISFIYYDAEWMIIKKS